MDSCRVSVCDSEVFGAGYVEKQMMTTTTVRRGNQSSGEAPEDDSVVWFHRNVNHVSWTVDRRVTSSAGGREEGAGVVASPAALAPRSANFVFLFFLPTLFPVRQF